VTHSESFGTERASRDAYSDEWLAYKRSGQVPAGSATEQQPAAGAAGRWDRHERDRLDARARSRHGIAMGTICSRRLELGSREPEDRFRGVFA